MDMTHWKSVGAQLQLPFCPVAFYSVDSQNREIKRLHSSNFFIPYYKKLLHVLHICKRKRFSLADLSTMASLIFHLGRLRQKTVMNTHEFDHGGTLSTHDCEDPYHFSVQPHKLSCWLGHNSIPREISST